MPILFWLLPVQQRDRALKEQHVLESIPTIGPATTAAGSFRDRENALRIFPGNARPPAPRNPWSNAFCGCPSWWSASRYYWLVAAFQRPHDSLAVAAMYRHHDMQYYPLISSLAQGNFGEGNLWENKGQGLVSFPFASVSLHAICMRLFGIVGLMVADGLGTLCYFLVVLAFLRLFMRSSLLAACLAFLVTGNILDLGFAEYLRFLPGVPDELRFRGYRIPRPFITEIHFVACLSLCLWILGRPDARQSKWVWGGFGGISGRLAAPGRFSWLFGDGHVGSPGWTP